MLIFSKLTQDHPSLNSCNVGHSLDHANIMKCLFDINLLLMNDNISNKLELDSAASFGNMLLNFMFR